MSRDVHDGSRDAVDRRTRASVLGYQPALDGIRCIAILMVLVFHTDWHGKTLFQAGYLGVDLFFVLSGFLISVLLLQEARRWRRISLRNFYVRRALRLLPLAGLLALVGAIVNRTTSVGFAGRPEWQGVASVALYFANWMHLWRPNALGFMGHAWSLAIEEQFYLLWPPVLVLLLWRRASRWILLAVPVALALGSAGYRAYQWYAVNHFPARIRGFLPAMLVQNGKEFRVSERIYYSSVTHADGLLIGCALAVLLVSFPVVLRVTPKVAALAAGAGTIAILLVIHGANAQPRTIFLPEWGLLVFEVAAAAITGALVLHPGIRMARVLSHRAAVWVGRRSYGVYVIHGVVFSLLSHVITHESVLVPTMWAVTFALAALSYRYVEGPILRLKDRFSSPRVSPSLAT